MIKKRKLTYLYFKTIKVFQDFIKRSLEDNIPGLAAQMSYYFILAFFPFMIFIIALLSYTRITSDDILANVSTYIPQAVFKTIYEIVKETVASTTTTLISVGALATLWVGGNAVESLMIGLNHAYDTKESRPFWKVKLVSILFTIIIAFVYIMSLMMVVFGSLIARKLFEFFQLSQVFIYFVNIFRFVIPIATLFILFMVIYKYLSSKTIPFRKIIPGAIFSTFVIILISHIFSIYINNFGNYTRAYGSIGSIIVLLLWLYWCSITIMLGAEIIATLHYFNIRKIENANVSKG